MSARETEPESGLVEEVPPFLGILLMALLTILLAALLGTSALV